MNTPTLIIKTLIDQLESEIVSLHARLCAEEYQFLVKLREFDLRQGWCSYHFNHCAGWLNMKCGISLSTGREKLRVAKALFFLPHISGAYQNGELSYSKVRAMTRVATEITERELLGYARKATASQVDQHCAGLRNVQQKFSTPCANRAHAQRRLRVTPTGDGRFLLNGGLPEESARLVLKALELCMAQARREEDPSAEDLEELENPSVEGLSVWEIDDPTAQRAAAVKLEQQNADALVDIAQVYLAERSGQPALRTIIKCWCMWMKPPCGVSQTQAAGVTCPSKRCGGCVVMVRWWRLPRVAYRKVRKFVFPLMRRTGQTRQLTCLKFLRPIRQLVCTLGQQAMYPKVHPWIRRTAH